MPISAGSAGLCSLPYTAGPGDPFCAKGKQDLYVSSAHL